MDNEWQLKYFNFLNNLMCQILNLSIEISRQVERFQSKKSEKSSIKESLAPNFNFLPIHVISINV